MITSKYFPTRFSQMLLAVVIVTCPWEQVKAQCSAGMEHMSVSTNKYKCGSSELCGKISTPPKIYLNYTRIVYDHYFYGYCDGWHYIDKPYYDNPHYECENQIDDKYNTVEEQKVNRLTCETSTTYKGEASEKITGGACGPDSSKASTLNNDGTWSSEFGQKYCLPNNSFTNATCSAMKTVDAYHYAGINSCGANGGSPVSEDASITTVVSAEYLDGDLRKDMIDRLPPYSFKWDEGTGASFYSLSGDHRTAEGGKMKYRVKVPNSIKKANYTINWFEVKVDYFGYKTLNTKHDYVVGTGDPTTPAYGKIIYVDVPSEICTIWETDPIIVKVEMP